MRHATNRLPTSTLTARWRPLVPAVLLGGLALGLANCASDQGGPRRPSLTAQQQREVGAFADSRRYGRASPRVVQYGQSVPKGGGRDHLGRPYRVAGKTFTPRENPNYSAVGRASWYGFAFHGRKTSNGEVYDKYAYTAAHPTLPLPSYVRVTNLANNRSMIVRVNDRGPFHGGRIIDVSQNTAEALGFKAAGTAQVRVDFVRRAGLAGSDDRLLLSTLRTDGALAQLPGGTTEPPRTMIASAAPLREGTALPPLRSSVVAEPSPTSPRALQVAALDQRLSAAAPAPASAAGLAERAGPRRTISLPPERPFDLGTIPGAGAPTPHVAPPQRGEERAVSAMRGQGAMLALRYAPDRFAFSSDDPMRRLRPATLEAARVVVQPR